eukprot:TRINITY_DN8101_c0_g1_i1.p1 TRINITY_DN8101_c0_g1~~TRINITY_DN8101_c0_g1_i1.p1  ORF type:complete len:175 (-),score=11.68 TRINITY_DN8101_c0_g1_i1:241-765(-)
MLERNHERRNMQDERNTEQCSVMSRLLNRMADMREARQCAMFSGRVGITGQPPGGGALLAAVLRPPFFWEEQVSKRQRGRGQGRTRRSVAVIRVTFTTIIKIEVAHNGAKAVVNFYDCPKHEPEMNLSKSSVAARSAGMCCKTQKENRCFECTKPTNGRTPAKAKWRKRGSQIT